MTSSSICVLNVRLSFSWDNVALPRPHNTALLQQPFTQPLRCTWSDRWTLWFCACICSIVCACTHAWIHACVTICVWPSMRARTHACMWMHLCMSVIVLHVSAHSKVYEFLCGQVTVFSCVFMCFCVYVNSVSGLQGSAPYLALAAGGVQQVPNCCRPHNGFYKPGAGTGLWLSCRLGSPPLYPCRLHWRSSQSMEEKKYYSSVTVN